MKPITNKEVKDFFQLGANASYDYVTKQQYRRLGRKILKYIAAKMQLTNYEIRFNPGGEAVSGEHTLHNENFYLQLSGFSDWFYYRSCKGLKDYTGGPNQIVNNQTLMKHGVDWFADYLKLKFCAGVIDIKINK